MGLKVSRVRWNFLRAYLLVALLVVVTGLSLEAILERQNEEHLALREGTLVGGGFLYAQSRFPEIDERDRDDMLKALDEALAMPADLYPLADFASLQAEFAQLEAGRVLQLYDAEGEPVFYRRHGSSDWVLALGPAPALDTGRSEWVVPLFYSLIALAVFLWIRPLGRDLDRLQRSAKAFGEQDFSSRVQIPPGSWLAPLAQAFNSMAQRIEWLLQSHREMTYAVSHELRTPLARLRFGLEMLSGASAEDQARQRAAMDRDIEELNALIEEMLSYAELEQSHLTPDLETLELGPWLESYAAAYNRRAPRIPLLLDADEALCINADERLLARALDNLVGNAQRFATSLIAVRAHREAGRCVLHVMDDGPGIPAAERDSVFSAYVRLDQSSAADKSGFGLGLAIVARIMQLHSGEVRVGKAQEGGADFCLVWQAAR